MQTTTAVSTMQMTMNENPALPANRELFRTTIRKAKKTDWDRVIVKADRLIAGAGVVILAMSALYFVPVFVSILSK